MLAEALADGWSDLDPALVKGAPSPPPEREPTIPLHLGALAYYRDHR